jgi:superfamily II DNA or RNA helicase
MRVRFDRGTVIIDGDAEVVRGLGLPGVAWDPRVGSWRAPARWHRAIGGRLSDAGVRWSDEIAAVAEIRTPAIGLRWYQEAALAAWAAAGRRGVVALPTGAGKTRVALAAIGAVGRAALCLVPTRVLLEQWVGEIERVLGIAAGQLGDGVHRIGEVTVATYASAIGWAPRIGDRFELVVVDEAHHVGRECPREVLDMLVAPARLGLSATPVEGAEVEGAIGPLVYALGVSDLTGDALAELELIEVPVRLDPQERGMYRRLRAVFREAYGAFEAALPGRGWEAFVRAAMRTAAGREAMAAWRASRRILAYGSGKRAALRLLLARHAGERALIFAGDNATAYAIASELLVAPITCEIGRPERTEVLARFREGTAPVLVSAQVLDEGIDVPEVGLAIVVGGSGDPRRHVQRIGRVLRPPAAGGDKRARVYELVVAGTTEERQVARRRVGIGGAA